MPNVLLAVLLTCSLQAIAAAPVDCSPLCGAWQLDVAASDPLEPALDAAFAKFKQPRPKELKKGSPDNLESLAREDDEAAMGPTYTRPLGNELRKELTRTLTAPKTLDLSANGRDILISIDGRQRLRLTPGVEHSRTDYYGTAEISVAWRKEQLVVTERYDRKRQYTRQLGLRPSDGAMVLTQEITRQGVPALMLRSVYRRPALTEANPG